MSTNADGMKCSVGYFYLEGLALVIDSLKNLSEIKILMGLETTALTKEQLIKTLEDDINLIRYTYQNISAVTNFHKLVREAKTLQVRAYELFLEQIKNQKDSIQKYISFLETLSHLPY